MTQQTIIKDTVLEKLKENNAERLAEERKQVSPYETVTTEYRHKSLGNRTEIYTIRATYANNLESETSCGDYECTEWLGWYQEIVWEYEEWLGIQHMTRVTGYHCNQETGCSYKKSELFRYENSDPYYTLQKLEFPAENAFVDRWNLMAAQKDDYSLRSPKITPEIYKRILKAREIIQKRKEDPRWQTIIAATKQLCQTASGKATARKLIQDFLNREQQHTK